MSEALALVEQHWELLVSFSFFAAIGIAELAYFFQGDAE